MSVIVLPLVSGVPHMKEPTVSLDSMGKWQGRKVKAPGNLSAFMMGARK